MLHNPEPELRVDPIVAWKVATLEVENESLKLRGTFSYKDVSVGTEVATCHHTMDAESHAPDPTGECACGFNAYKEVDDAVKHSGFTGYTVVLQVQLFGRIVEYEEGYRAQKQQVLGVYLYPDSDVKPLDVRQAFAVSSGYITELPTQLAFHPAMGWVSPAEYINGDRWADLCEVCLDPIGSDGYTDHRCARHSIEKMYGGGYETSRFVYDAYRNRLVTGAELIEMDRERALCEVCFTILEERWSNRCDKHDIGVMHDSGCEVVPGTVLRWGRLVPGRELVEADKDSNLCEICLTILSVLDVGRRCPRHTTTALYGVTTKGEDTDPELRIDKRGEPYVYQGFTIGFSEHNTGMRSLLVFYNKKSDTYTISVVWQTRVDTKGLVYPTRIQRWIKKDDMFFRKVRGKLKAGFPYSRTSERRMYEAIRSFEELTKGENNND